MKYLLIAMTHRAVIVHIVKKYTIKPQTVHVTSSKYHLKENNNNNTINDYNALMRCEILFGTC